MDKNFLKHFRNYLQNLNNYLKSIDKFELLKLENFFNKNLNSKEKKIFLAGNGGSAATAGTMYNDLGFDLFKKKGKKIKLFSLVDNISSITAISNDTGYENVFLNQLKINHNIGDHLLVISASGNSKNLIKAIQYVKKRKGKIISFLGFDGGKIKKLSDICIHINTPKNMYGPVEDGHLVINHIFAHWFQKKIK